MRSLLMNGCLLFALCSCEKTPNASASFSSFSVQTIEGRDEGMTLVREPLYRAEVPLHWERVNPLPSESIFDTTKSLCEFMIEGNVKMTIHNFPIEEGQNQVPVAAQTTRWKGQFESLDSAYTVMTPQSHDGFVGLCLECEGIMHGKATRLLGWVMQLAPEHEQRQGHRLSKAEKADYTIKVLGSPELVLKHHKDITRFANSFELIHELYSDL